MFGFPRQSRDSCTTRLFLLAHAQTKVPSVNQGTNHGQKIYSQIFFLGILRKFQMSHFVKWKHLQNGGHFVANFMNILKEF